MTLEFAQGGFLEIAIESFLVDRKASGCARSTIAFYASRLKKFTSLCDQHAISLIQEISADFLRQYLLKCAEDHNPGGVHACFRSLRVFFRWLEFEEVMPAEWKNPIHKVKAPKVPREIINPIALDDVQALIDGCKDGNNAERDKAIFLCLLDTGVRASELCNIDLDDLDLGTGSITIKQGKGRKPRTVYVGRKTKRAIRAHLRTRKDHSPALFTTIFGDRLTYMGLREILRRRSRDAGLQEKANLHDFRRAFALNMLRNGADIFSLQRLMGHSDLSVLQRYLAQTDLDLQTSHLRSSPVDHSL